MFSIFIGKDANVSRREKCKDTAEKICKGELVLKKFYISHQVLADKGDH